MWKKNQVKEGDGVEVEFLIFSCGDARAFLIKFKQMNNGGACPPATPLLTPPPPPPPPPPIKDSWRFLKAEKE